MMVRDTREVDCVAVQSIYAHYVLRSAATFEEVPPTVSDIIARRAAIVEQGLPHLVAEIDGEVVGYTYASAYRPRAAYRYSLEDSVYVADGFLGRGIGRALLTALIQRCESGPWRQLIAIIGDSGNTGSIALHERLGFRHVGTLTSVGFKFERWVDTVLMQRAL
jgi:L-amino acid N-acyltransferase YncA